MAVVLTPPRINLWSSGGGTQSTAIAVLILQGKLPCPDLCVIADTEREKQATWDYMDDYTGPALRRAGIELHRIAKSDWMAPDLYDRKNEKLLMPVWTDINGPIGKKETWCSTEWKRDVVRRWANAMMVDMDSPQFLVWMGMSFDEPKRIKPNPGKWQPWYPLFEMRLRRADCVKIVTDYGWPAPPSKSACWMCPHHRPQDWVEMEENNPVEFAKACELEAKLRSREDDVYLHEYGMPLREAVAHSKTIVQGELFDEGKPYCNTEGCFV